MGDTDGNLAAKTFQPNVPVARFPNEIKGTSSLDWGMKNRMSRILDPATGRTVMLAFDRRYFQGPTSGLERIDLGIAPISDRADALMCTRGALRFLDAVRHARGTRAAGIRRVLDPQGVVDEYTAIATKS